MKNKIGICIFGIVAVIIIALILNYFDKKFINSNSETEQKVPKTKVYETVKEVNENNNTEAEYNYSLKIENEMLVVYNKQDKLFDTGIGQSDLPSDLCKKIEDGFGFNTEQELYDFLESYSS